MFIFKKLKNEELSAQLGESGCVLSYVSCSVSMQNDGGHIGAETSSSKENCEL
jgi:hypothetical protein